VAEPDTIWNRFRRNPMALIGLFVVLAMVLGIVGVGAIGPPAGPPTATPAAVAAATTPTKLNEVTALTTPTARPTGSAPVARKTYSSVPAMAIDVNKSYTATIATDKGAMVFTLLPKVAPVTVNAFVVLSRDGFYNGLTFHRVENWVIQGGDPRGDGTGGPGYSLPAEFSSFNQITGTLAMARSSDPNSAGSQFYVTLSDASFLNGQYTAFGQIVSGMDVASRTAKGDIIRSVVIEEK
jgi:peptidylprolyl isomerase